MILDDSYVYGADGALSTDAIKSCREFRSDKVIYLISVYSKNDITSIVII